MSCSNWLTLLGQALGSLLSTGSPFLAGLPQSLGEMPAAEHSQVLPGEALCIASNRCHTGSMPLLSPRPMPLQALTQHCLSLWLRLLCCQPRQLLLGTQPNEPQAGQPGNRGQFLSVPIPSSPEFDPFHQECVS